MRNIRLMTMNIQCQAWPAGPHSDAKGRAQKVVKSITSGLFAWDEEPDIIVFNEADNESAKDILEEGLKDLYPHYVVSFNGNSGDLNDGGLAIFSKFPFVRLTDNPHNMDDNLSRFYPYVTKLITQPMSSGSDGLAEKGVALVKISTGLHFEEIVLAFTHLQAFYDECGENFEIRLRQLKTIEQALIDLIGPPEQNPFWDKVIVMGDLNIWGDQSPLSTDGYGEWANVFVNNGGTSNAYLLPVLFNRIGQLIFTGQLVDGWRTFNTAPGKLMEADPGYTNTNLVGGDNLPPLFKSRLDYICFPKERTDPANPAPRRLAAQYMRILPTGYTPLDMAFTAINSDHKAILTQVHWDFPFNTPGKAKPQSDFHAHAINGSGAVIMITNDFVIASAGVFQWIYIDKPGTYTFNAALGIQADYYYEDAVSVAINPYRKVNSGKLGLSIPEGIWQEFDLNETGDQVDIHKPMFICLRAAQENDQFRGNISFSYIRHTGETRALSIGLEPNEAPKDPRLPKGQPNGSNDDCWFRIPLPYDLYSGEIYPVTILLNNDFEKKMKFELYDSFDNAGAFLSDGGKKKRWTPTFDRTAGIQEVFLNLKRSDQQDVEFSAAFRYSISFLNYLSIYCEDDQSGLGADEIHLTGTADGGAAKFIDFKDEDFSDDEHRYLMHEIKKDIVFQHQLDLTVFEMDGSNDSDGPFFGAIPSLKINEKKRDTSFIIYAEGAEYRINYTISRQGNRK